MKEFIDKLLGRLEEINEGVCHYCGCDLYSDVVNDIINQLAEEYKGKYVRIGTLEQVMWERDVAISQLEALGYGFGEKVGWIPVSERLPEKSQRCIVSYEGNLNSVGIEGKYVDIDTFNGIRFNFFGIDKVSAWMPLPTPYKEGEN